MVSAKTKQFILRDQQPILNYVEWRRPECTGSREIPPIMIELPHEMEDGSETRTSEHQRHISPHAAVARVLTIRRRSICRNRMAPTERYHMRIIRQKSPYRINNISIDSSDIIIMQCIWYLLRTITNTTCSWYLVLHTVVIHNVKFEERLLLCQSKTHDEFGATMESQCFYLNMNSHKWG